MGHFFISYSRRDFYFAESLFYALQGKGIDAWMDVWKITPGDNWDRAIKDAIQSCQGFILIATKESLQSPNVQDEIRRAYQARKPLYLVIRGRFSKQDLHIPYEYPQGTRTTIDLSDPRHVPGYVRAIIDMRAGFKGGLERITAAITRNVVYRDTLPGIFSFKMEQILYLPLAIAFLALFMVVTQVWKFGLGVLYEDPLNQIMGYIRDILHGAIGEVLLLVPSMIAGIVAIGSLVIVINFSFNFSRRKRMSVSYFVLFLLSSTFTGISTLWGESPAVILGAVLASPLGDPLKQGGSNPPPDVTIILLLVVHLLLFFQIVVLGIVFVAMFYAKDGRGAILRWLPTGYATEKIRREGNAAWIKNLPDDINLSPVSRGPSYQSYCIVTNSANLAAAREIRSILERKRYSVTIKDEQKVYSATSQDERMEAECYLIMLSSFSDDRPLQQEYKASHSQPTIYVIARSMKPQKDASIDVQWIDYRRPAEKQFWKQWEKHFSNLKSDPPVFPYVPEALGDPLIPLKYRYAIILTMLAVAAGSALLISGMEYLVLVRNTLHGLLLLLGIVLLLGAMSLGYYTILLMSRGVISSIRARRWLLIAGIFAVIAALMSQSLLLIVGSLGVILVNMYIAKIARKSLHQWLPPKTRKSNKKSLLQPISNYKAIRGTRYSTIMIAGFLGLNALITNWWIIPYVPQQSASKPYAVTVPGPYYLAAPGSWSQDALAEGFGYHFDYHSDELQISQDRGSEYPTWLKFSGTSSYPMQFAPHFRSSIHVQFTNNDLRTDFGFVLNDIVGDTGPQLRLTASGVWLVIESDGTHFSGLIAKKELSQDYTLEVEVNGILCTYKINGKEITVIADTSMPTIKDILFSFSNYVAGGTTYYLSNFTYTPLPGPVLSRNEAIKLVNLRNSAPYTTVAPGWNCNPDDGRWNAGYEPTQQDTHMTCTATGTRLNPPANSGILFLNFVNSGFGDLPDAFDYSFDAAFQGGATLQGAGDATFQDANAQCIALATFASITTTGLAYMYVFDICSDGSWAIRYIGYHTEDFSVFLAKQLTSGHIDIQPTIAVLVEFRSTTLHFYINHQLVTSYKAPELLPSTLFTNDKGPVLYSNFSYVPRTQQ